MGRLYSLNRLQFVFLTAALLLVAAPALGQDSGTGGGNALQGGVRALDSAAADQEHQTMRINLGSAPAGFFDNGQAPLHGGTVHTERVPPEVFRGWLTDNHSKFALSTQTMSSGLVIDVAGRWDHADKTLTKFGINYTEIRSGDISPQILAGARVLIINCAGEVKRDRLQFIRDFVQRGGYLLSTDWALNNMLEQTFPGYLIWNKGYNSHSIYWATYIHPDPILAKGCVRNAAWKLDEGAHLVRVVRQDVVRVLVTSADLCAEDPDRAGILACVFPFGKGYVLHMVGHFDNNAAIAIGNFLPDPAPNIKISLRQAIAANFVVAGLTGEPLSGSNVPTMPTANFPPSRYAPPPAQNAVPSQQMPQGMRQDQNPPQGLRQDQAPPERLRPDQAPPQGLQPDRQQGGTVQTAPGVMPPLAPDRLHRP